MRLDALPRRLFLVRNPDNVKRLSIRRVEREAKSELVFPPEVEQRRVRRAEIAEPGVPCAVAAPNPLPVRRSDGVVLRFDLHARSP